MNATTIKTPMGKLFIEASDTHLQRIQFSEQSIKVTNEHSPLIKEASRQLTAYFSGKLKVFDLPLELSGTLFQKQVQQQLLKLPYGSKTSYKTIATQLEKPKASRAIGAACKKNPLLIVIPCHRVISSSGKLTGFAAGINRKQQLIAMEAQANQYSDF